MFCCCHKMFKPSSLHLECVTHPDVNNILLIFIQKIASKANFCLWKILKDIKRVFDWDLGHQNSLPGKCTLILYQFFQSNHFRVWTWFVLITLTCKQQEEMWSCVVTILVWKSKPCDLNNSLAPKTPTCFRLFELKKKKTNYIWDTGWCIL